MKSVCFLLLISSLLISISADSQDTKAVTSAVYQKLSFKIIDAPSKTFGYDIYNGKKRLIHQPSIPAVAGNKGFKSKADAEKVAKLVIKKIKKGEMPPTVSIQELKNLKVID